MRVAIYARVSTIDKGQDPENQLQVLRARAHDEGHVIVAEYVDHKSGKTDARESFQQMKKDAAKRKFQVLYFWSLDRFSREGVLATLTHLNYLSACGVQWQSHTEAFFDACGPFKDVVLAVMAVLAKQEVVRRSERVKAGLQRIKENSARLGKITTKSGRPSGRPSIPLDLEMLARRREEGASYGQLAKEFHVSASLVAKKLAGMIRSTKEVA